MTLRHIGNYLRLICALACLVACGAAAASEYHGQVDFAGMPLPGATVTAMQGDKKVVAVTDEQGAFSFPDLADGTWTIEIEMTGFSTIKDQVVVAPTRPNSPPAPPWELKMLPLEQINAQVQPKVKPAVSTATAAPPQGGSDAARPGAPTGKANAATDKTTPPDKTAAPANAPANAAADDTSNQASSDGFLINGTQNNGAASPFAQLAAFGNNRNYGGRSLYNGSIGFIFDTSALDAQPFSLSGQPSPKPAYDNIRGVANLGGPLKIPHLFKRGPNFFVGYEWARNRAASTQSALVPDLAERLGNFSNEVNAQGQPIQIFNPATGLPFAGNTVPISPQAQALLNLYPMPNLTGNPHYNYQTPTVSNQHIDALNSRFDRSTDRKNQLNGGFAFSSTRSSSDTNIFGFLDTTDVLGINTNVNWIHHFSQRVFMTLGYQFSWQSTLATPYWENRENVSGEAGITGNDQTPMNWGPPSLSFASIQPLSDGQAAHNRNQTSGASALVSWYRIRHNFSFGGDFKRRGSNYLSQQNPRGTFSFTGAATAGAPQGSGSDLADFLLGIPDSSAIAYGNADKYFRESVYDAYVDDEWKVRPSFTMKVGLRWEYGAPVTELLGRLVNLDITPTFGAVAPVLGYASVGPLTGQVYPTSLVRPDKHAIEPHLGIAWRPLPGSTLVVRAGYSIAYDTSVYQSIAAQMAQQAPLSTSLLVQNSAACPLTLANGFTPCSSTTADNFAIDPNFRVGYVQTWSLSLERDLPGSLHLLATYQGIKGTRGPQEFLPNTYPVGATNPCPACPIGFTFLTSNGNSEREAGIVQLRRRLHNGLTANLTYTFSKSMDDDSAIGGQGAATSGSIAQNWLDLHGERGLSTFDQRHLLTATLQYTTGMGLGGGTLLSGWRGRLYKEWTILIPITVGSGLPETPSYSSALVPGTGFATIRPDTTGAPLYVASGGLFLNPAAYAAPVTGQWGTAGRDSITGPAQFTLNGSMSRTFRLEGRFNLDVRFDSTNLLNHVTFASWNTAYSPYNTQFGLPTGPNGMRTMLGTLRLRF